jgi:multiple sugar transport system ATP-binding protein
MASVTFDGVGKTFADGTRAVSGLDLAIEDGEFMVFVGPSGCGKTTALRMVAGLEEITEGELRIGDRVVNRLDPRQRDVAMVFQSYALYPHLTVAGNIAFPLRARGVPRATIDAEVARVAQLLGLEDLLKRRPRALSGGQRQRVAMGRALVRNPQVSLMDEPLSNLDAKLRVQMRVEISRLQRDLGTTTIYVTHDQVEAMTMGDRIAIMRKGELQQQGPSKDLYDAPANLFVATFIGSPAMNLFRARIERDGDGLVGVVGDQRLALPAHGDVTPGGLAAYVDRDVALGVRPEHLSRAAHDGPVTLGGRVRLVETLGAEQLVHVDVTADPVLTDAVLEVASDTDASVAHTLRQEAASHTVAAVASFAGRTELDVDGPIELAVDVDQLHFFDLESGNAIRSGGGPSGRASQPVLEDAQPRPTT